MRNVIISTVGTSLITKLANQEQLKLLYQYSNCNVFECPELVKDLIDSLYPKVVEKLNNSDIHSVRRSSAELNGILGFYNENLSGKETDVHFLICTDTYQGRKSAESVKSFLNKNNIICEIIQPKHLSTKNKSAFSDGIKELLKWFDETIGGYKDSGYQIVFNLTGGFKSLQGYLNTIAMFYADKIIYIFESDQAELIEIPKLPITLSLDIFKYQLNKFLILSIDKIRKDDIENIPESLVDEIDNHYILSVWGELFWNKVKYDLLNELVELPYLIYEDSFKRCFKEIKNASERIKLLETLAKVSSILLNSNGDISGLKRDGGLQYENYENKLVDNLPIGHFRVNIGDRISCVYKNNKLYLRKYGRHDDINNNP